MLVLEFSMDGQRFGLKAREIQEVLPHVELRPLARAPECVAGLLDYRGKPLPVIDVSTLLAGRASRSQRSTRIIVVPYGEGHHLGLLAEYVTQTVRLDEKRFAPAPMAVPEAPFLGEVACPPEEEMLVLLRLEELLTPELRALLYPEDAHV